MKIWINIIITTLIIASIPSVWYGLTKWFYPLAMFQVFGYFLPLGFAVGCVIFGSYSIKGMGIGMIIPYSLFLSSYLFGGRPDYPLLAIGWIILVVLVPILGLVGLVVGRFLEKRTGGRK